MNDLIDPGETDRVQKIDSENTLRYRDTIDIVNAVFRNAAYGRKFRDKSKLFFTKTGGK